MLQETVDQVAGIEVGFTLCDLVVMVREFVIDITGMNIEGPLEDIDVSTWSSLAPG
jgi:hypothetical protein